MNQKFDYNDITLVPAVLSTIKSRSECDVLHKNNKLPLICAPMDTVIDNDNVELFKQLGILTCSIRSQYTNFTKSKFDFISVGLEQFEYITYSLDKFNIQENTGILIDIANGHIGHLYTLVKDFKEKYNVPLMVGNIANPETYRAYCEILSDKDFIRAGIGAGNVCSTSANTGIHYPYASLIEECFLIKESYAYKKKGPNIVADGGIRNFDDINTALCLGADYVMVGSLFAKTLEACFPVYYKGINVNKFKNFLFKHKFKLTRTYRGMSTKDVQKTLGKKELRTSEGIVSKRNVEYTLAGWIDNFKSYLKSCMSYSGTRTLKEFIGNRNYVHITNNALLRYKK